MILTKQTRDQYNAELPDSVKRLSSLERIRRRLRRNRHQRALVNLILYLTCSAITLTALYAPYFAKRTAPTTLPDVPVRIEPKVRLTPAPSPVGSEPETPSYRTIPRGFSDTLG